jgi:hypothetical protein
MSNKYTIEFVKKFGKKKNILCLDDEYYGCKYLMNWRCLVLTCKWKWEATFDNIKNADSGCPRCSGNVPYTIEEVKEIALTKNVECLDDEYVSCKVPMNWKCLDKDCLHKWTTSFDSVRKTSIGCPKCSGNVPYTIEEVKHIVAGKNIECLDDKYINTYTSMIWKCLNKGCNCKWSTVFGEIVRGSGCPNCSSYKTEKLCREICNRVFGREFCKVRLPELEGLELDGYEKTYGFAFEYNGLQHYKYVPHFHRNGESDFLAQQERDKRKRELCKVNKIELLEIPHAYNYQNPIELENFIIDWYNTL